MTSKLSQLLDLAAQDSQRRKRYREMGQAELAPTSEELMDILRLGYWPLSHLEDRNHWLAQGQAEDDCGLPWNGPFPTDQPVSGYLHNLYIQDHVHIWLHIAQGNQLESDDVSCINWGWGLPHSSPDDGGHQRTHTITSFAQVDHLLCHEWPQWVEQQWPDIDAQMQKYLIDTQMLCTRNSEEARDAEIHSDLAALAWGHWGHVVKLGLEHFEFADWSALDEIDSWIKK